MKADVHMHSNFSHDSECTPEQMILGAIDKGLRVICFTDHYDKDDFAWGQEDVFDPEAYFKVMKPLQEKYKGKIEYVVIRSNIQDDKILFIDNTTKEVLGTGFDELERLELAEILRGDDF